MDGDTKEKTGKKRAGKQKRDKVAGVIISFHLFRSLDTFMPSYRSLSLSPSVQPRAMVPVSDWVQEGFVLRRPYNMLLMRYYW